MLNPKLTVRIKMNKSQIFKTAHKLAKSATKNGVNSYRKNLSNALVVLFASEKFNSTKLADYTIQQRASGLIVDQRKNNHYNNLFKKLGLDGCFCGEQDFVARNGGANKVRELCVKEVGFWVYNAQHQIFQCESMTEAAAMIVKSFNSYYA